MLNYIREAKRGYMMNDTVRNMVDINTTYLNDHFKFELSRYTNYMSENVLVDKRKTKQTNKNLLTLGSLS